jgi:hypothetical protein
MLEDPELATLQQCLEAFTGHDYAASIDLAQQLLRKIGVNSLLIHIGLVSFQRHHAELAEQLGESLLTDVAAYPGLDTLIRVTLGRVASE